MNTNTKTVKGFTLIELLVVIGILAVLSVVIILTLNPAELLKQARDSTRISDLATLRTAISLYQVDKTDVKLGDSANCYYGTAAAVAGPATMSAGCQYDSDGGGAELPLVTRFTAGTATHPGATYAKTDSTGWVRIDIASISTGSGGPPISTLPLDPVNTLAGNLFYAYRAGGVAGCNDTATRCTTYEINTTLESTKFAGGATDGMDYTDGGNADTLYEVGTALGL